MDLTQLLPAIMAVFDSFQTINLSAASWQQYVIFGLFSFLGVVVHIGVDIYKGQIVPAVAASWVSTLIVYLFVDRLAATVRMVSGVIGLAVAYFATMGGDVSYGAIIIASLTAGYTSDSLFNRVKVLAPK